MFENLYAAENLVSPLSPKGKVENFCIYKVCKSGGKRFKGLKRRNGQAHSYISSPSLAILIGHTNRSLQAYAHSWLPT